LYISNTSRLDCHSIAIRHITHFWAFQILPCKIIIILFFVIVIEWMLIWIIYRLRRIIFGTIFYFFLWLINSNCLILHANNTRSDSKKVIVVEVFFLRIKIDQYLFYCVWLISIKQRRRVCCKDERMENTYLVTVTSTTWQPVTFVWTSIQFIFSWF
jgi:hypothetical protein